MTSVTNEERFFFAMDDAEFYDDTIALAVPQYSLILQTLVEIFEVHFADLVSNGEDLKGTVMDVGAGTGAAAIPLLKRFKGIHALAVDLSAQMKPLFAENARKALEGETSDRFEYVVSDIMDLEHSDPALQELLRLSNSTACMATISAYCIHHFTRQQKVEVYKKMFEFLSSGGLLVNIDLFNYTSRRVSSDAHDYDLRFMQKQFEHPDACYEAARTVPIDIRMGLLNRWVDHMNRDNILGTVDDQIKILREIGFADVECPFRFWQQGIIVARKP